MAKLGKSSLKKRQYESYSRWKTRRTAQLEEQVLRIMAKRPVYRDSRTEDKYWKVLLGLKRKGVVKKDGYKWVAHSGSLGLGKVTESSIF